MSEAPGSASRVIPALWQGQGYQDAFWTLPSERNGPPFPAPHHLLPKRVGLQHPAEQ